MGEVGDVSVAVDRLRRLGYEVREVSEGGVTVGWVVRVGGRYVAVSSGVGRGGGGYVVMDLPDEDVARRFLVGRFLGNEWGDPEYVKRAVVEEYELKAREQWFRELTQRGLRPVAYSKVNGRAVVSENDLFFDERTGVTYRAVLERRDGMLTLRLVPASERDERRLAVRGLEAKGYRVVDDVTVEKDGVRYRVEVVERGGEKVLRLVPYPEDVKKLAEAELWRRLQEEGYVRRGDYAVKGGVQYRVEVVEKDGGFVAKLTPVGVDLPEWQRVVESLGIGREFTPDVLRFGVGGRPGDVPYVPVLDELVYGATGVPLSQWLQPASRDLYWRYSTSTLPGPRIQGFTVPEWQTLSRVAEIQRLFADRFKEVWTPLSLRLPTEEEINWRTALASLAEAFTFWIPVVRGAAALAAARGVKLPVLTTERTAVSGRGVKVPSLPGDYFEIHYVEPGAAGGDVRGVFVGQAVGEGVAVRGTPGNWEAVFVSTRGEPGPGWAFEQTYLTYRDVSDILRRIPSLGLGVEVKPRIVKYTEVRGFARDVPEPPKPPRYSTPMPDEVGATRLGETPRGGERPPAGDVKPPEGGGRPPEGGAGTGGGGEPGPVKTGLVLETRVAELPRGQVASVNVELPVLPLRMPAGAQHVDVRSDTRTVSGEVPIAVEVPTTEGTVQTTFDVSTVPDLRITDTTIPIATPLNIPLPQPLETPREQPTETPREQPTEIPMEQPSGPGQTPIDVPVETPVETPSETPGSQQVPRYVPSVFEVPVAGGRFRPPAPPVYVRGGAGYRGDGGSVYLLSRMQRPARRGWRVYEALRI